jgi:DNA-binding NtrC family response regulator
VQHLFGEPDRHGIVGESPAAWELRLAITAIGARPGHVLILGASGTGKELIAQAIHSESASSGALVARNASTLPESILDAELFGNLKGYPNPGMAERAGLFGAADGGSLFLDEIAELPISAQTHLLRVLDAGEYQRLGATTLCRSAFRLIAATNQPESSLRADVRARFTFRIQVPDLARRREDIPLIARYLLRKMGDDDPKLRARLFTQAREARLSPPLIRHLASHPFSSNVRELRNLLWEAAVMGTGNALERGEPSAAPTDRAVEKSASAEPDSDPEPSHLQRVLDAHNGSIDRTWRALGLPSRFAMMRLIKKHGLRIKKEARQD